MKKLSILFLLLLLLFAGCSENKKTKNIFHGKELDAILTQTMDSLNAPGVMLYVRLADGSEWYIAKGVASIDSVNSRKICSDMQFRIASVTKTFVSTAILQLVDQKKFNLDDDIFELLPNTLRYDKNITVRMVLNHSSAIPDYATNDIFQDIYIDSLDKNWSRDEILNVIKDEELLDEPGNESYYSNMNYYLLGMLIEKYSEQPIEVYLKENIFDPLKMASTYFSTDDSLHGDYLDGYFDFNENGKFEADEIVTIQSPSAIWSAGMIVSNLDDLKIWLNELNNPILISKEMFNERMKFNVQVHNAPEFIKMGLGLASFNGAIGHTGALPGYTTILFRYKGNDIIACSNCYHIVEGKGSVAERLFAKTVEFIDANSD